MNKIILQWILPIIIISVAFSYIFADILYPFIFGLVLAYLLSPLVTKLQSCKVNRELASIIVVFSFFSIITLFVAMLVPLFYSQMEQIVHIGMNHKDDINDFLIKMNINHDFMKDMQKAIEDFSSEILNASLYLLKQVLTSGMAAINIASLVFVTPIITYYIIADWVVFQKTTKSLIPISLRGQFEKLMCQIDQTMSGYLRGQLSVCMIMAVIYCISFYVLGLSQWLALGFICGTLTFIPYLGVIFSGFLSGMMLILQFGDFYTILQLLLIFVVAQFIEGNFLIPKLIGNTIKLHPVWIIFGLMAGMNLMGVFGMLIALPLTALISVLIKFSFNAYKRSSIYQ